MSPRVTKPAARTPRQQKTDHERALERLGIEQRRVERAEVKHQAALDAADEADRELDRARVRLAYAEADPALTGTSHSPNGDV